MNLLDIQTKKWDQLALNTTAPNLEQRLGDPVDSHECIGNID